MPYRWPSKHTLINGYGIDLYLHRQGIDITTPAGKAIFQMLGVFAEFERAMIRERVNAGLARARAKGKVLGRSKTTLVVEEAIRKSLRHGVGILKTAKFHGVGTSVVQRIKTGIYQEERTAEDRKNGYGDAVE